MAFKVNIKQPMGDDKDSTPPNEPRRSPGRPAGSTNTKTALDRMEKQLQTLIENTSVFVMMANQYDGAVMAQNAPVLSKQMRKLAEDNPAVRRVLEGFLKATTMSETIAVFAACIMPILWNHGIIPKSYGWLIQHPEGFTTGPDGKPVATKAATASPLV